MSAVELDLTWVCLGLACGRDDLVPYKYIYADLKQFISKQYLPKDWNFKDPRNIHVEEIKNFFDHIWQRQQTYPPDQVFRFKEVTSQRRKGVMQDAMYTEKQTDDAVSVGAPDCNIPNSSIPKIPKRSTQPNLVRHKPTDAPHLQIMLRPILPQVNLIHHKFNAHCKHIGLNQMNNLSTIWTTLYHSLHQTIIWMCNSMIMQQE